MTTAVTVNAHAGWPVDVTPMLKGSPMGETQRVAPGTEQTFYVHSGQDLLVSEVQPAAGDVAQPEDRMLQFFGYKHLPPHLQAISRPFGELAERIVATLPSNPERTVSLRKLLEAKDCAVRAHLYK